MNNMYDLIIVGGGAAGIFAAIQTKNSEKKAKILVLEKNAELLFKVKISGGGRCNATNACFDPKELCKFYPRGGKELLPAFYVFQPKDMIEWLNSKNVKLKTDDKGRVFPCSDRSDTIINCFFNEIKNENIEIKLNQNIKEILKHKDYFEIILQDKKFITRKLILATGSQRQGFEFAKKLGHTVQDLMPSLFSFKINRSPIQKLSGINCHKVEVKLKGTSFKQTGDILITHEGFSGPAVINLSSFAAKYLFKNNYRATLIINWLGNYKKNEIEDRLINLKKKFPKKNLVNTNIFGFTKSLWAYFLDSFDKALKNPIKDISNHHLKKLADRIYSDEYQIISRSVHKQEFVTCGGVTLKEVNFKTMESKICKNLYFAGEILDIDAITGGFNFQNAWTTGFIAGNCLKKAINS